MRLYTYRKRKAEAREQAQQLQKRMSEESLSYDGLAVLQDYLQTLGKRYGLLKEFRENGLI